VKKDRSVNKSLVSEKFSPLSLYSARELRDDVADPAISFCVALGLG
jgi:hypothetical protein